MTTKAELDLIRAFVSLIIQAETGRPANDLGMPVLIQSVIDEITVNVGPEGGFVYLMLRAGKAGVDYEELHRLFADCGAILCLLPKVLYQAINRGIEVSAMATQN